MSEFLAEAIVRIAPDTTRFRAELLAQLTAVTRGVTATIPVTAIVAPVRAGQAAAVRAAVEQLEIVAAQQTAAATTATKAASASRELTRAQTLTAAAGTKLAVAQSEVRNVTSALAAAQVIATRSAAALVAAERALTAARAAGNAGLIAAAQNSLRLALAQEAEAVTALQAAKAQSVHAASLSFLGRGAGATGLSLLGVRGATLAANSAFLVGAAAVVTFAKSVQLAAGFEQELNVFRVTARATADEMKRMREQAVALGRDISLPGVSAIDAAQAMTELAKAGLDVEDALAGARGVLQLAAAAQISNAEATELAASALNAFGLGGEEAVHVADLLANAANEAQGSISDMGLALRQSAAVARQVGISLDDTVALLTLLARNGLQGSDAGTALRTSLIRLINPTKEANSIIQRLGVNLRDALGNIRPEVFADFAQATAELTRRQQDATAAIVFGQDAIRAQAILGREGTAALDEIRGALDRQGAAAELAGARTAGFSGKLAALKNSLETLGVSIGEVLIPPLETLVDILNEVVIGIEFVVDSGKNVASETAGSFQEFVQSVEDASDATDRLINRLTGLPTGDQALGSIRRALGGLTDAAEQAESVREVTSDVRELFAAFREDPGPTALNQLVLDLEDMADRLAEGDAEAQRLAQGIREIIREVQNFAASEPFREGFVLPPLDVDAFLASSEQAGRQGGSIVLDSLREILGDAGVGIGIDLMEDLGRGAQSAAAAAAAAVAETFTLSLTTQIEVAEARGASDQELLRLLRARAARQEAFLERVLADPELRRRQDLVRKAANNLERTNAQIQAILDQQASDAKAAAADIVRARSEADQAILDSIGAREARLRNRILAAEATATLRDDIRTNEILRGVLRSDIEEARRRIRDAKLRAETIRQLTRDLIQVNQQIRRDREEQRRLLEEERQQRIQDREEALRLNVEFAQITGNRAAEIRAQVALVRDLERQIKNTKLRGNKLRELRNELARERARLKELRGEVEDRGRSFRELTFEFLQTQQGFAANLLSNLLPAGAAAGTVGGAAAPAIPVLARPERAVAAAAAVTEGRDRGVTQGQFSTLIDLTRQMVNLLSEGNRGRAHPEARNQSVVGRAALDYFD